MICLEDKLVEIIHTLIPCDFIVDENTLLAKDLGYDSLKMVGLIFEIEKHYGIEFSDNDLDITKINTVGDLRRLLQGYIK